ncbi:SDR family NAD(P)-dependent oxidoreductase [Chitinophaga sp. RAB17]|uniref:SDR family NAD(P)-dependent oxidoreductase n=1 Tax=Chitinophaga sp. RAB17 TaxID=3233049 RepID=UPI003F91F66C
MSKQTGMEIAVIGMSGRFPGAADLHHFWNNLVNGVESISRLSDEDLLEEGEDADILKNKRYVKASSFMSDKGYFDADFFGYRPEEATLMNPQIRIFHELCWNALEDAGYNVRSNKEKIGLFAGGANDLNWQNYTFLANEDGAVDDFTASQLRDTAYLCSRISYLFNLQGPSVYVNTACSTSLVAIQRACMSLLLRECSMAMAGGITVNNFSKRGYLFQEGMINSPDGHCRPFDADAAGTVAGEGGGVVVLKRLADAIKDRDHIYAVVRGYAVNNDGNRKMSFAAPSVEGQHAAIVKALNMAGVPPESISYIEAHGTGTELGDPIEVEALNKSFGAAAEKYCALGSVKSNIGHLDAAAGVAGFIKTVLAMTYRKIPASLYFKSPNPRINFTDTPFYVNHQCSEWHNEKYPLRAGVSSFGIGGTNAHVILEEPPVEEKLHGTRPFQLMVLSGKTSAALERNITRFSNFLEEDSAARLEDIAYTLQTGRTPLEYRRTIVSADKEDTLVQLAENPPASPVSVENKNRPAVIFMFPGQGAQYAGMFDDLYEGESIFREAVDKCLAVVLDKCGKDLRPALLSDSLNDTGINNTAIAQPALFIMEYALSQLLMAWGIHPDAMIGHSIGEYVAACVSGVFSLEDSLVLVVRRGELMQQVMPGAMLGISMAESELRPLMNGNSHISLAAVNSPSLCVVSGVKEEILHFREKLDGLGYNSRVLHTSHAFHSYMMDEILDAFAEEVGKVSIRAGKIPFISNLTGDWATVIHPKYWVDHLRNTVMFRQGLEILLENNNCCFIEVGPGNTLSTFVRSNTFRTKNHKVIPLLKHAHDTGNNQRHLLKGIGECWLHGINPDWNAFYRDEQRRRVSVPVYSFEKTAYPVIVDAYKMIRERTVTEKTDKDPDLLNWFYTPVWKLCEPSNTTAYTISGPVLLLADDDGVVDNLQDKLREQGAPVVLVKRGTHFRELSPAACEVNPGDTKSFMELFEWLSGNSLMPERIINGWSITGNTSDAFSDEKYTQCFYGFIELIKICFSEGSTLNKQLVLLTSNVFDVLEKDADPGIQPLSAGLLKVVGQEYPGIRTCHLDISLTEEVNDYSGMLLGEISMNDTGKVICLRGGRKWEQLYDKMRITPGEAGWPCKQEGVYLVTGGLGAFGFHISKYLLQTFNANILLLGRSPMPDGESRHAGEQKMLDRYAALQQEPGAVMYVDCDIADTIALSAAVRAAESRLGQVNGVVHAAGIIRGKSISALSELTKADFEEQFAAKVTGVRALEAVFADRHLDFCLLVSSLSVVLGGLGFSAYAAANTFMDLYIRSQRNKGKLKGWMTVDFDALSFDEPSEKAITTSELINATGHALRNPQLPQVVVAVSDLSKRIENWVSMKNGVAGKEASAGIVQDTAGRNGDEYTYTTADNIGVRLMHLWKMFFGKSDIGAGDDFFDIGGDSLKALTMIARIKKEFNIELSITSFFRLSSIQQLAAHIADLKSQEEVEQHRQQLHDQEQFIF